MPVAPTFGTFQSENGHMICEACRERRHGECSDGTWCDCQHKPPAGQHRGDRPAEPGAEREEDADELEDGAEPSINWLRQG